MQLHNSTLFIRSILLLLLLVLIAPSIIAKPTPRPVIGRRAIVIDERLSPLREKPNPTADLIQRLRRGRVVGILRELRTREGYRFLLVSVTRRTRGWILAEAVVRSGSEPDAQRLLQIIGLEKDGFARVRLSSIFIKEMSRTRSAPRGYLLLGESADAVAGDLTRNALRRLPPSQQEARYLLNDVGLDRYSRLGVRFRCIGERLIYDGTAYRELLRRYPASAEAAQVRSRASNAPDISH